MQQKFYRDSPVVLKDSVTLVEEKLYTGLVMDKTPTEFLLAVSDAKAPLVPTKRSKSKNQLNKSLQYSNKSDDKHRMGRKGQKTR